jgi:hypothetical protein
MTLVAGAGLGAGLMYLLDPQAGRRRRALVRDKAVSLAREVEDAAGVVTQDMKNRAQGLAAGDFSVLAGGRRALNNPLRGGWSPSGRALMTLLGGGLFLYGMTRDAPLACFLGTVGLGMAAEGITNAGIDDLTRIPQQVAGMAEQAADRLGLGGQTRNATRWENAAQPAGAGR